MHIFKEHADNFTIIIHKLILIITINDDGDDGRRAATLVSAGTVAAAAATLYSGCGPGTRIAHNSCYDRRCRRTSYRDDWHQLMRSRSGVSPTVLFLLSQFYFNDTFLKLKKKKYGILLIC